VGNAPLLWSVDDLATRQLMERFCQNRFKELRTDWTRFQRPSLGSSTVPNRLVKALQRKKRSSQKVRQRSCEAHRKRKERGTDTSTVLGGILPFGIFLRSNWLLEFASNRPLLNTVPPRRSAPSSGVLVHACYSTAIGVGSVNWSGFIEAMMNCLKSVVVCIVVVVAICGCDRSQPTPPVAANPTPPATTNPTPVELPESADSIGMQFKLIPAGTFTMGRGNGAHEVTLTKPFKLGVHEVTQAQYEQVMGKNPSYFKGAGNPVERVSWHNAVEFCRKLSALPAEKAAGNVYRLPTEAEWEYAYRAGTTTNYSFGDDDSGLGDYAWFRATSGWFWANVGSVSHPVGGKKPNVWGCMTCMTCTAMFGSGVKIGMEITLVVPCPTPRAPHLARTA
jgi:formylglycine-generating enzyme required for sulfatase activity